MARAARSLRSLGRLLVSCTRACKGFGMLPAGAGLVDLMVAAVGCGSGSRRRCCHCCHSTAALLTHPPAALLQRMQAVAEQSSGTAAAPVLLERQFAAAALLPTTRLLHTSAAVPSAAAASAEPEPVPHAVWEESELTSAQLTPRQVVEMLDRNIVGQAAAKKAVANALRNRWRRHKVPSPLRVRCVHHLEGVVERCMGALSVLLGMGK